MRHSLADLEVIEEALLQFGLQISTRPYINDVEEYRNEVLLHGCKRLHEHFTTLRLELEAGREEKGT